MCISGIDVNKSFACYPSATEIDLWAAQLLQKSRDTEITGTFTAADPKVCRASWYRRLRTSQYLPSQLLNTAILF